ncbi:MAG: hypothetical protein Q8O05_05810 [Chloroflexota bacterium]|nr:hypothetical protein [Chloroflexota bacterium]
MNNRLVKWLREFRKPKSESAAGEEMLDKDGFAEVAEELEKAAAEVAAPGPESLESGDPVKDFVIPRPIKLELADKLAPPEPVKLEGLTETIVPPEPIKLEGLVVKQAKLGVSPQVEENKEEKSGLMGGIFEQDEAEEDSVLRGLINSLPDVTAQELLLDMVEVKVLMREWSRPGNQGKGILPGKRVPG